ncbi:hypothetical protein GCM10009535_06720 [Streptomyces thermocarboxydovorans]|uniref:Uncharacterized protein n=1 Tax=Streptomyces thermocarboxydovorans TaxID=59298 RepID=A0ABP3SG52_9ACTN
MFSRYRTAVSSRAVSSACCSAALSPGAEGQSRLSTPAIHIPRISPAAAPPPAGRRAAAEAVGITVSADSAAAANALRETRPMRTPLKTAGPPVTDRSGPQDARPPRSIIGSPE